MRYKNKSIEIEAVQFGGSLRSQNIAREFIGEYWIDWKIEQNVLLERPRIKTPNGEIEIGILDYIIKFDEDEFYPCNQYVFEAIYERVD